jgi:prolycopene isomerase
MREIMKKAARCQYCEYPRCSKGKNIDIRGFMRRVTVGNFIGAKKIAGRFPGTEQLIIELLDQCEKSCVLNDNGIPPVEIKVIHNYITSQ